MSVSVVPRPGRHRRPMTAPKTQKAKSSKTKKILLTVLIILVVLGILVTAGYFSKSQYIRVVFSYKDKHIHWTTKYFPKYFKNSFVLLLFSAVKQLIDSKYFFCKRSVRFIPLDQTCDGKNDCKGGEDEIACVSSFSVNTTFPGKVKASLCPALSTQT